MASKVFEFQGLGQPGAAHLSSCCAAELLSLEEVHFCKQEVLKHKHRSVDWLRPSSCAHGCARAACTTEWPGKLKKNLNAGKFSGSRPPCTHQGHSDFGNAGLLQEGAGQQPDGLRRLRLGEDDQVLAQVHRRTLEPISCMKRCAAQPDLLFNSP